MDKIQRTAPKIAIALLAVGVLAGCQTTLPGAEEAEPAPPPPYPPGYTPAGFRIPEQIQANLPADVTREQVLIADDGCYFYHRGPLTAPVLGPDGKTRYCLDREPVGTPIEIDVVVDRPPKAT